MVRLIIFLVATSALGCGSSASVETQSADDTPGPIKTAAANPKMASHADPTAANQVEAPNADAPVTAAVTVSPATVQPGESATLDVRIRIAPGWHIYGLDSMSGPAQPTQIEIEMPANITAEGDWAAPSPISQVTSLGIVAVYESEVRLTRKLHVDHKTAPGVYLLNIQLRYQACDDSRCLSPTTLKIAADLRVQSKE